MIKKIISALILLILILIVLIKTDKILYVKWLSNETYYKDITEPKNVDVLFLGTSRFGITFRPLYIFETYGVTSYNLGTSGQPYAITELLLKKYKPKYAVVDVSVLLWSDKLRKEIDLVNLFPIYERLSVSRYLFGSEYKTKINTLFKYHYRWHDLKQQDFNNKKYKYAKGAWLFPNIFQTYTGSINIPDNSYDYHFEKQIQKILSIANTNYIKIIFVIQTNIADNREYHRQFITYAEKNNLEYIDYNNKKIMEELNLDYTRDMIDRSHLNIIGSYKVMDHLIPYMIKKYHLKDHRDDPKYKSWYDDIIKYNRVMNKLGIIKQNNLNQWFNLAFYDNYTMLISTNGDNVLNRLPQSMKDKFKSLGLNKFETDKKNQKYAAIIDNNQVFFEEVSDKKVEYKGRMKNLVNLLVSSEFNKANINVSGKPRAKNRYGINFVIYDKVNREIVDSIWVDPAKPDEVRR